jgi:ABC-type multidrug transport system fused ATPase/permease subunit
MSWKTLLAGHRRQLIGLLALGLLQTLAAAGQVLLTTRAVDRLESGVVAALPMVLGLAVCLSLAATAREWERLQAERLGHRVVARLRTDLFRHLLRLDLAQVERLGHGGMLLRLTGDLEALRRFIGQGLVRLPVLVLSMLAALGALAAGSGLLALSVALTLTCAAWASLALGPRLRQSLRGQRRTRARLAGQVNQRLQSVATVRANAREERELTSLEEQSDALAELGSERARMSAGLRWIAQLAAGLGTALALGLGALEVGTGSASLGDVVASLTVLGWLAGPVQELSRVFDNWHSARLTREKLNEVLGLLPSPREREVGARDERLRCVGLTVDPLGPFEQSLSRGSFVVLVGINGSGKSRLLRAIAGLEAPRAGRVLLNGQETVAFTPGERRRAIGFAEASPVLVAGSLSKNLRYRVRRPKTGELEAVIQLAGLEPLVRRLPAGLETSIGPGGAALSEGERARIGLARALLGTPQLLVLDEVDAHLDQEVRAALLKHLVQYPGIALVASHDPRVQALARQTWLLSDGQVRTLEPSSTPASGLTR